MLLSRQQILAADDRATETVAVPEWGGDVCVRALSGTERDALEFAIVADKTNVRARFLAKAIIGEDGQPLFTPGDVEALGAKNAAPIDRVFTTIQRLSGLGPTAVEDAEKNFAAAPTAASTSDSPNLSE